MLRGRRTTLLGLVLVSFSLTILVSASFAFAAYGGQVRALPGEVYPASVIVAKTTDGSPTCAPTGICPSQLDTAYGFGTLHSSGTTGAGQTVIIDDACGDPNMASDLTAFDTHFGLPVAKLNIYYPEGTKGLCVDGGWSLETSLDVEMAHTVAPGATIDLLVANTPTATDVYQNWVYAFSHSLGNQISNSYGGAGCYSQCNSTIGQGIGPCTLTNGTEGVNVNKLLTEAQTDHVTILASAGDSGAWGLGTTSEIPIPGDCQGVLTVGGTTLNVTSTGKYLGEIAWSGTGGGYVTEPAEPKYQMTAGINNAYGTLAKPDVAAVADPNTGVWIYNLGWGGWLVIGGTSVASPIWAGFLALVNQIRASNGLQPAGFVNRFLYLTVYGSGGTSSLYSKDFHDITMGNNGSPAGTGWDPDTGLGSFIAPALAHTLGTNPNA
jgi:subtilase family serine protease